MKDLLEYIDEAIVKKPRTTEYKGGANYNAVDLGLSVKWADCNVGAKSPEEPGLLFQWGRTDGYEFGDENHKFLHKGDYCTSSGKEYAAGDTLDLKDDAAAINMGGEWRMPTKDEITELITKTKHKWCKQNGVKGVKITGKNGNSIFIPGVGFFDAYKYVFDGENNAVTIWTSKINIYSSYGVMFDAGDFYSVTPFEQYLGMPIRGVCE